MKTATLDTLFLDTLKDIYYAERKILKALPKMARAAQSEELTAAFEAHKAETEGQKDRLEQVFESLGKRPVGKTCPAIDGILEEGEEVISEFQGSDAIDAGLIASATAVEHYEIARYTALQALARQLGHTEAASLLAQTLAEETAADQKLTGMMPAHLKMAKAA